MRISGGLGNVLKSPPIKAPLKFAEWHTFLLFHTTLSTTIHTMNPLKNILPFIARMSQTGANATVTSTLVAEPFVSGVHSPSTSYIPLTTIDPIDSLWFGLSRTPRALESMTSWWVAIRFPDPVTATHPHPNSFPQTPLTLSCGVQGCNINDNGVSTYL